MAGSDGRKIDRNTLEYIRVTAIRRVLQGESPEVVIREIGFSRTVIYEWLKKYKEGGIERLRNRKATGRSSKLSNPELRSLYEVITYRQNDLWTRNLVGEFLNSNFGIILSGPSIGHQLEKLKLTCKRTTRNINPINEKIIRQWAMESYPLIRDEAQKHNAEIWFLGESKRPTEFHVGYRMLSRETAKQASLNLTVNTLSGIKPNNVYCFMAEENSYHLTYEDIWGGERSYTSLTASFMEALIQSTNRHVIVIVVSNSSFNHHRVQEVIKNNREKLSVKYLPVGFPKPKHDEHIWHYIKRHVG